MFFWQEQQNPVSGQSLLYLYADGLCAMLFAHPHKMQACPPGIDGDDCVIPVYRPQLQASVFKFIQKKLQKLRCLLIKFPLLMPGPLLFLFPMDLWIPTPFWYGLSGSYCRTVLMNEL